MKAKRMGYFTKSEWMEGMKKLEYVLLVYTNGGLPVYP